jgi:dimethylhistidine N-methyltransferase
MMPATTDAVRQVESGPLLVGFAADVRDGLSAPGGKTLPARYLYDAVGSALFEAICLLPEYGLSRADHRVLEHAAPELTEHLGPVPLVVELGSGSGRKTRVLLAALAREKALTYRPIDLSAAALQRCRRELAHVPGVFFAAIEADFLVGLQRAASARRADERLLLLFLGSTIGNFERPAATRFLREVRARLRPGDALLLGTDLLKPVPTLLAAYDDTAGVTAAFDLNLLARINRELGGDFDLRTFAHEARWNEAERRVEMHLRALRSQLVRVRGANLRVAFREGETIWTEGSCKYDPDEPALLAANAGFQCVAQWVDEAWPFAESLLLAA